MEKQQEILGDGQLPEMVHMLGTRVKVKCVRSGNEICGKLEFVGYNSNFPSWGLHCTVSRMPGIHINSVADIQEHVLRESISKPKQ